MRTVLALFVISLLLVGCSGPADQGHELNANQLVALTCSQFETQPSGMRVYTPEGVDEITRSTCTGWTVMRANGSTFSVASLKQLDTIP